MRGLQTDHSPVTSTKRRPCRLILLSSKLDPKRLTGATGYVNERQRVEIVIRKDNSEEKRVSFVDD